MALSSAISGPSNSFEQDWDRMLRAPNGEFFLFGNAYIHGDGTVHRPLYRRGLGGVWTSRDISGNWFLIHFEMVGNDMDVYTTHRSADNTTFYIEKNFSPLFSISWSVDYSAKQIFVDASGAVWVSSIFKNGSNYYPAFSNSSTHVELTSLASEDWANGGIIYRKWKNLSNANQQRALVGYITASAKYLATVNHATGAVISNITSSLESALTGHNPTGMEFAGSGFINDSDMTNYLKCNGDGYQYIAVTNSGAHLVAVPAAIREQTIFGNDMMFGVDWTGPAYEVRKCDPTDASGLTFGSDSLLLADELLYDMGVPRVISGMTPLILMGPYESPRATYEFRYWEAPSIPTDVTGSTTIPATGGAITLTEDMTVEAAGELTLSVAKVSDLAGAKIITVAPGGKIQVGAGHQITVLAGTILKLHT